jgi:hypothetical protein
MLNLIQLNTVDAGLQKNDTLARKETSSIEVEFMSVNYLVTIDLLVSDQLKLDITKTVGTHYWTATMSHDDLLIQNKRWAVFANSKEVFTFIVEEMKANKTKFEIVNQVFKLKFGLEMAKGINFELVLETHEKEASISIVLSILSNHVSNLLSLVANENSNDIRKAVKIVDDKVKSLTEFVNKPRITTVFHLKSGTATINANGGFVKFPDALGSIQLEKDKYYRLDLQARGLYGPANHYFNYYRIGMDHAVTNQSIHFPHPDGDSEYFNGGYWTNRFEGIHTFQANTTAKYDIYLEVKVQSYNIQWDSAHGDVKLYLEGL